MQLHASLVIALGLVRGVAAAEPATCDKATCDKAEPATYDKFPEQPSYRYPGVNNVARVTQNIADKLRRGNWRAR